MNNRKKYVFKLLSLRKRGKVRRKSFYPVEIVTGKYGRGAICLGGAHGGVGGATFDSFPATSDSLFGSRPMIFASLSRSAEFVSIARRRYSVF
jgi:hypothetical protein